jgi:hypothetical protein
LGLVVVCLLGCDSEGSAGAVTHQSSAARQVSTLLATLTVDVDGEALDPTHIAEVHLEIDGALWGVFSFDAQPADTWSFVDDGELVLRAPLHASELLEVPRTAGEWRDVIGRTLTAGDHVARIAELRLRNGAGEEIALSSSRRVVFEVDTGDSSAWIGDIGFELEALP